MDQVSDWAHRGLIDNELLCVLQARYSTDISMGRILLRWLGFLAVFLIGMSLLGFIGLSLGEATLNLAPFVIGGMAFFMWIKGVRMATDPQQRYATSGAVLVTISLLALFATMAIIHLLLERRDLDAIVPYLMLLTGVAAFFTAYRYALRWPLTLGILLLFHGLGNMHSYAGHGSYFFGIQDERLTSLIALISIVFGVWHEKQREHDSQSREVGFGQVYIVIGLLYLNLSLWILSLSATNLVTVMIFSAACVAQIILGGRLHDGRFIGFGIVFLSIDIYTRMFENFWDDLSKGVFFLISGVIALGVGIVFEKRARKLKAEVVQ